MVGEANDLLKALRLVALPVGADEQVFAAWGAPCRTEGANDVGEDVGDLHHPVVSFWNIGRGLHDNRLPSEIEECLAVEGIVVRGHDDALRRRQIAGDAAARVDGRARPDAEHRAGAVLHQLPHAGARGDVDGRISPVVDDTGKRLDVVLVGEQSRGGGRPGKVGTGGIECLRKVGFLRALGEG